MGSVGSTVTELGPFAGLAGAALGGLGVILTRRSQRETNTVKDKLSDLQVLRETVEILQSELERATQRLDGAERALDKERESRWVLAENVAILRHHVLEHVPPDVPFPRLRVVSGD